MSPTRPLRVLSPERARRDIASRPIYPQVVRPKAPADASAAAIADAALHAGEADALPAGRHGRTRAVLITMIGLNFGAVLGVVAWPMLQALQVVSPPVIETVQREQSELLSQLDASVRALNTTVTELHARVSAATERQEVDRARLAEIDLAMGALRSSLSELRSNQDASVAELTANAAKARSDIVKLRASIEELSGRHAPQAAVRAPIRGSIAAATPAGADEARWPSLPASAINADGHIFVAPAP